MAKGAVNHKKNKKEDPAGKRKTKAGRQSEKKKKWIVIGSIVLSVLVVLTIAGIIIYNWMVDHYLDKINVVTKETDLVFETEVITSEDGSSSVVEEPDHNGELSADNLPLICNTKDVKNFLILAVDSRGNDAGRTDSMILVSVNSKNNRIVLCSFMRDILAKYPKEPKSPVSGKYDKLNHAHAYGGPELTMAVLKETFNIDVSHYAKVNFSAFRDIVDAMGGLDIQLSAEEARAINSILSETMQEDANKSLHVTSKDMLKNTKAGVHHLTGVQALSHARNRRVGSDYARTQRQRDLIEAMAKKATTLSLSQLNNLLNTVLPLITTNMPKDLMKDMIGDAPSYLTYEIKSTRVPADGMFTEKNYNIIPDLEKNCYALYELIYGEKAPGAPSGGALPTNRYPTGGGSAPAVTTTAPPTTTTAPPTTTTQAPVITTTKPNNPLVKPTDKPEEPEEGDDPTDKPGDDPTDKPGDDPADKPSVTAPSTTTNPPQTSTTVPTTSTEASDPDEKEGNEQN
ncbi:MAG: LCP family protein [Clostridia bacterium]|nr:LCP family protein [Clostridia bacterium]